MAWENFAVPVQSRPVCGVTGREAARGVLNTGQSGRPSSQGDSCCPLARFLPSPRLVLLTGLRLLWGVRRYGGQHVSRDGFTEACVMSGSPMSDPYTEGCCQFAVLFSQRTAA